MSAKNKNGEAISLLPDVDLARLQQIRDNVAWWSAWGRSAEMTLSIAAKMDKPLDDSWEAEVKGAQAKLKNANEYLERDRPSIEVLEALNLGRFPVASEIDTDYRLFSQL